MSTLTGTRAELMTIDGFDDPYLASLKEEQRKVDLFMRALDSLKREHHKWWANYSWYLRQPTTQRLKWIKKIEQQAAEGLPTAGEIVARALAIRMTK